VLLAYAVALHGRKEYDQAATHLEHVLALDPQNGEALYLLGDIAQIRGDLRTAEELAQRVLASEPRHPGANLVAGLALMKRGDYAAAQKALETAAIGDPGYGRTQYHLSQVYTRLGEEGRAAAARAAYEESVRKSSEQQQALRRLLHPSAAKDKQ
jgi:predicted Zn-dependent protease